MVLLRDPSLASDTSQMADVVLDVISRARLNNEHTCWLLQPTSPFRTVSHFRDIANFISTADYKSYISVVDVGAMHPNRVYQRKNGKLFPIIKTSFKNKQELPPLFIRNGCFYIFKAPDFVKLKTFYITPCYGVVMEENESVNIDGPRDLEIAKIVLKEMSYGRVH